ncbi:MAG: hypothetical protein PHP79_11290 [Clostridia bacterium]|nr:hypothetical protein [Clostridia bacterium]
MVHFKSKFSPLLLAAIGCSALIILLELLKFYIINGAFTFWFLAPILSFSAVLNGIINISVPVIFILLIVLYGKKIINPLYFIIPAAVKSIILITSLWGFNILEILLYKKIAACEILLNLLLLLFFILTAMGIIKSKYPFFIVCIIFSVIGIIVYLIPNLGPASVFMKFIIKAVYTSVDISGIVSLVAFYAAYACIGFAIHNNLNYKSSENKN